MDSVVPDINNFRMKVLEKPNEKILDVTPSSPFIVEWRILNSGTETWNNVELIPITGII